MKCIIVVLLTVSLSAICTSMYLRFRVPHACDPPKFLCPLGGVCIQESWVCDGDNDCPDHSDEDPSKCGNKTCSSQHMRCNDTGRCIPISWQCDGDTDCGDGSDESAVLCEKKKIDCLAIGKFECAPGICIPMSWKCDGASDCSSGADEAACSEECSESEFKCADGTCIDKTWVCDGDHDCTDHSDEKNCRGCRDGGFLCRDKSCIPQKWRCDGDKDCLDNSDEENCTHTGITTHKPTLCFQFLCPDRITCINNTWVCDGKKDCPEGEEESEPYCKNVTCQLNEFKCNNNKCVPGSAQCNGYEDCTDGSDEKNCEPTKPPCKDDEFDCGDSFCIPLNQVCDGTPHCPKSEDEPGAAKCKVDECSVNNGGCSQKCVDTPTGYYCTCYQGFKLVGNSTCDDIDECEDPASCSQTCINEKGTFKCECLDGYVKENVNHRRCKASNSNSSLIVTRRHDIREVSVHHKTSWVLVNETKSAIALDIHIAEGLIFYSDAIESKILKVYLKKNEAPVTVVEEELTLCDGLAVDWIYNHIYWTDSIKDTIFVANFDGKMRKSVIIDNLDKPRAIALNPLEGWMFWSDWGIKPRIERAGMDGTHRSTIVSHDLLWPNGITLDLVKNRLYWIDARLDMISSVNFDGSLRRTVLHSAQTVVHPFSIAVFEDYIYWTDWARHGLFQADKFNGSNVKTIIGSLSSLMVVHVNHPYKQPNGTNYCKKMNCSHICLPAPRINKQSAKATCACPNGLRLLENGLHCSSNAPNVTTSQATETPTLPTTVAPEEISTKRNVPTSATINSPNRSVTTQEPKLLQTSVTATSHTITFPAMTRISLNETGLSITTPFLKVTTLRTTQSPFNTIKINQTIHSSKNDALNGEEHANSSTKYIVAGIFIALIVCVVALALLHVGYKRYYNVSQSSINSSANYRKMGDDEVSLLKNDNNQTQLRNESSSSRSPHSINYDNFL